MPTYEYLCDNCHHNFEIRQNILEKPWTNCPKCNSSTLYRVLHAVPIITKGEALTVGQQADRNMAQMGHYELEDKRKQHAEAGKIIKPKAERPFWRSTDKINTELAKLAPNTTIENGKITKSEPLSQKAIDYIMTGKK